MLILCCIIKSTFWFLIGMYNIYGIEMYPTAVSGLGNGFMKAIGLLAMEYAPQTHNVNVVS